MPGYACVPIKTAALEVKDYKHSTKTPFMIDLRSVGQGRLFFETRTAANQELVRIKIKLKKEGQEALNLSDRVRIAALEGERKLSEFGKDVRWAIDFALDYLQKKQASISFYKLVAEYLEMQSRLNRSEIHQKDLRIRYARFCADFGETATRVLTTKQIQDWLLDLE